MEGKTKQEGSSDKAIIEIMYALTAAEEVQAALKEQGVTISLHEIREFRTRVLSLDGEMTEEQLDKVAGGVSFASGYGPDSNHPFLSPPVLPNPSGGRK